MTWIAVFGSTVVMLLWIVIYSFFASIDFVDEVVILFGELTFWTTVIFAATVALGMCDSLRWIGFSRFIQHLASLSSGSQASTSHLTSTSSARCGSWVTSRINSVLATAIRKRIRARKQKVRWNLQLCFLVSIFGLRRKCPCMHMNLQTWQPPEAEPLQRGKRISILHHHLTRQAITPSISTPRVGCLKKFTCHPIRRCPRGS